MLESEVRVVARDAFFESLFADLFAGFLVVFLAVFLVDDFDFADFATK